MLVKLNPLTVRRLKKFRRIRRGWVSLFIIAGAYLCSLGAEVFIGNRPVVLRHDGRWSFPALTDRYYSSTLFGGRVDIEADFRALRDDPMFRESGDFMILPPHPFSPLESVRIQNDPPPSAPNRRHPMGTDDRGRDVLARVVYGFRTSVTFALLVTLGSYVVGVSIGAIQAFWAGKIDLTFQRVTEVWHALPFLYVVTLIASIFTPNFPLLVLILMAFGWIGIAQYTRAEVYRERSKDYVTAARAIGARWPRLLFGHVLGNALTSAITLFPISLVADIFALTALDFLGFGLPAPTPSWGELFYEGRSNIRSWWLIGFPFLALVSTLLLLTFVGEAIREAWDPRETHVRQPEPRPSLLRRAIARVRQRASASTSHP